MVSTDRHAEARGRQQRRRKRSSYRALRTDQKVNRPQRGGVREINLNVKEVGSYDEQERDS